MEPPFKTMPGPCDGTPRVVDNGEPWQTVCLACGWDASEHENNKKPKQVWRYKDLAWMRIARFAADELSTCGKRQYCAIILGADTSVVGMGYNGGPSGMTHCKDGGCPRLQEGSAPGSNYDNCFAIHAEENALIRSSPERRARGTLLVNGAPCYGCAKKMCNANLRRIVVIDDPSYQAAQQGYDLMRKAGLELIILNEGLFV